MTNTDSHSEYCGMETAKSNNQPVIEQWSSINWKIVEKTVWKLQTRIYSASRQGNVKRTRQLQKTLLNSYYAKLLAVRRVTQENQGKRTAGVDGVKSLTPNERLELVGRLKLTGRCQPTRRVWIDKPGKTEKRPLSIPTISDRAVQALVKLAIEPEWEAVFEQNSFGFRPGRKAQDAIRQIKDSIKHKAKYVLDTDLEKCFDRINHTKLLEKAGYQGKIRRQIRAWLKSGVMDKEVFYQTKQGTPQGGICSPLLANIALHGMENLIKDEFPSTKSGAIVKSKIKYGSIIQKPSLIRYADDLVILCEDKRVILKCQEILSQWLQEIGLNLKPSKTRITHTLNQELSEDGKAGFEFLGYHIQQFPVSIYKQHTNAGKKILHKTFIVPSKPNQQQHLRKIKATIKKHKNSPIEGLVKELNPIIRGWCNYFEFSDAGSQNVFAKMSWLTFLKMKKWAKSKCKNQTKRGLEKYLKRINNVLRYALNKSVYLIHHSDFHSSSNEYIKVKGDRSPFDGDKIYWSSRLGKNPETPKTLAYLLKRQKGKCAHCGLHFWEDEHLEIDHIKPKAIGGNDSLDNLQALHKHCHDKKTRNDLFLIKINRSAKKLRQELKQIWGKTKWFWMEGIPVIEGDVFCQ